MGVIWADGSRYGPREHTRDARSLAPGGNKRLLDGSYNDRRRRTGERNITILLIIYCLRRSPAPPLPKLFIVNRRVSYHPNHARIRVRTSTTGFARARDNSNWKKNIYNSIVWMFLRPYAVRYYSMPRRFLRYVVLLYIYMIFAFTKRIRTYS